MKIDYNDVIAEKIFNEMDINEKGEREMNLDLFCNKIAQMKGFDKEKVKKIIIELKNGEEK